MFTFLPEIPQPERLHVFSTNNSTAWDCANICDNLRFPPDCLTAVARAAASGPLTHKMAIFASMKIRDFARKSWMRKLATTWFKKVSGASGPGRIGLDFWFCPFLTMSKWLYGSRFSAKKWIPNWSRRRSHSDRRPDQGSTISLRQGHESKENVDESWQELF